MRSEKITTVFCDDDKSKALSHLSFKVSIIVAECKESHNFALPVAKVASMRMRLHFTGFITIID
jgi:hypothetical protein